MNPEAPELSFSTAYGNRLLEGNDDNRARNTDIGFDGFVKMKEQPYKAAIGDCLDLAFDRIVRARDKGPREKN